MTIETAVEIGLEPAGLRSRLSGLISPQRAVAIVYALGMFMSILDAQIVNVAIPRLTHDFHTTTASVQWIITAYLMSIAVCVPASGWIGDRFGTKRIFTLAVGVFTLSSAMCAASSSLLELVLSRILQGVGGGMMVPTGMAMLYRAYPPSRRIDVARMINRVMVFSPALAPIIGGSLVSYGSWRWIFTINIPMGLMVLVFGHQFLIEHREPKQGRFDVWGFVLGGSGLGLLLYCVGSGPTKGWTSLPVVFTGGSSAATLTLFVWNELHREFPMLNLRLLRDRLFRRCSLLLSCSSAAFLGTLVFVALYLQEGRGFSPIEAGLATFPFAVGVGVASPILARILPRVGPRRLIAASCAALLVINLLLAHSGFTTHLWVIGVYCFWVGYALSHTSMSAQAAAFARISPADSGQASAVYNTMQRALTSLGIAMLSTVFAIAHGNVSRPPISSFHAVFYAVAALSILGVFLGLRIRDADAAAVLRRPDREPAIVSG